MTFSEICLHTHTHTHTHIQLINPSTRLFRAGLYGFSCNAAREADLFFAQGGPAFHKWGNVVEPLRQLEPMPKIVVEPIRQCETMPEIIVVPLRQCKPMPKIVVEPLRQCETMPKIAVEPLRQRETMLGLGLHPPPLTPLKGGQRKATRNLGPIGSCPVGQRPAGFPLLRGCPKGGGVRKRPDRLTSVRPSRVPQSRSPAVSRPAVP